MIICMWACLQNPRSCFSLLLRIEMPFGNDICLCNFPGSCTFRNNMVVVGYLQNPRIGCLFFACTLSIKNALGKWNTAPSGLRRPLVMMYTYVRTLGYIVSKYIQFLYCMSKTSCTVCPKPRSSYRVTWNKWKEAYSCRCLGVIHP